MSPTGLVLTVALVTLIVVALDVWLDKRRERARHRERAAAYLRRHSGD